MRRAGTVTVFLGLVGTRIISRSAWKSVTVPALLLALPLDAADRFEPVRKFIRTQLAGSRVPSLAVAVVKDGKILWEEGFGWANRERRLAATEHTIYSLASISKPITATGLMILVEAGKIDLDRPINDYLGAAKLKGRAGDAAEATVRRVANHTSGLPLHYQFFYSDEPYRPPSVDETILRYGNLIRPPGEKYEYSNLGYGILGYVISRVSGKSYEDFMREEVFVPLGMTRSSVHIGSGLEQHAAARYGEDGAPIPFYEFDHTAASAVWASAHDLARFAVFHLKSRLPDQKAILTDSSIDAMQQPTANNGKRSGYGIGWSVTEAPGGHRVVSHSGGMGGVSTTLRLVPSKKLAVAVLSNSRSDLPHRVSNQILKRMLPGWEGAGSDGSSNSRGRFRPPKELAGLWTGMIRTDKTGIPFRVRFMQSGRVHARLGDQPEAVLNGVTWSEGYLSARMTADIGTEDANRHPYVLRLSLKLRGDVLNGGVTAVSLPGARVGNALTHWVELRKNGRAPVETAP